MPTYPFTIRIFVPDGDPEGIRLISRNQWPNVLAPSPSATRPKARCKGRAIPPSRN